MLKPFANSARALATGPLTWRTWAGLIAVPLIVMGLLTWAFWTPDANHGTAKAAVVNYDEPVQVNGQTIPLGRQLAGYLTHSEDSSYTWVLTDADDAASGLADGSYAATVTIPKDFSARATSSATGKPLEARQARLQVQTSDAAGVTDPSVATHIATATQDTLNQQVVETYLDNVYVGFTTLHKQVGQAADGAAQLADGNRQLAEAAGQLNDGAGQLAHGTEQLAAGSGKLASGLTQAERDTAQLPALTRQLATGADQVADGNEQLASVVVPLANRIITAIDALPSADSAAKQFRQLAGQCPANGGSASFCRDLSRTADEFTTDAQEIDGAKAAVRANAVKARDSIQALAAGARKVADGNAQLAAKSGQLAAGIASAADGARQLDNGVRQANSGAHQLATGTGQLTDGAKKADRGAHELATQLDNGRDQVPSYTNAERAHLTTVAAAPSTSAADGTSTGTLALTLFAALGLWALALATYLITRAVPDAVLTAREPTWRIILRAAIPGATAAGLAAVAITAIAVPVLKLGLGRTVGFLLIALLAASAFVALNQAATAIFGRAGRIASLAVLVLAGATGVVSTLPGPLYALAGYLPTHGAVLALRAAATDGTGLATGVAQLAAWLLVGGLVSILVTDRRRYLSARSIRLRRTRALSAT
ncbi:ABC transporter permease [Amycolatopsis rubida]|uniref:ABC transporter permease n=1 Tax=Amycolatopsis rubida TaxID=112413 RepID=A0ABX0CCE3_9PSEU|nr:MULTISPECIES: YhgE/Pip family protein [Amycolatopsis]MYW97653.1 ABC transporter permease [Amycolatopsis rubida]NEC62638.1 ABC transporter permease [Amycolatopsis rubida]OAP21824.1 ABC-2 family transporter protein [Amycolatopsis sp. M39]